MIETLYLNHGLKYSMYPEIINISPIKLRNQDPTEIKVCYVSLYKNYLHYRMEFFANEPIIEDDPASGLKEGVYNFYNIIAIKEKISGIEQSFTADKKWAVYIIVTGFAQDIKMYFTKRSEAEEAFEKVNNWLIK